MKIFILTCALGFMIIMPAHADITLGLAAPLTGAYATLGEQMRFGAEQAIADINTAGGVNGQKLVLREEDDACDPKQAVTVANKLVNRGVKFVVGHGCSGASIPAAKIYNEENILMITPVSTNPVLTEAGYANVFRTCGRNDQEGAAQAQYMLKHLRDKKIAIVNDKSAVGLDLAEQVKKNLNSGGVNEIMFDSYTAGEKDYSALITLLKQRGVQVLVIGGYHVESGLITRQIKQQNLDIQVIGSDALATPEFWSITGSAGEGVLISYPSDPRKLPGAKTITDSLIKRGHQPDGYEFYAYAAVQVLAEGIKRVGIDTIKVAAALRQTPVDTAIGKLAFDTKGDVVGSQYAMYRWHDGKYEEISQ